MPGAEAVLHCPKRFPEGEIVGTPANTNQTWRFGVFELDAKRVELRRGGIPVKMREQSFRILVYLLEHAGEIVTREDLRQILWPSDTFVDFDHSLNTAVMKLREALGLSLIDEDLNVIMQDVAANMKQGWTGVAARLGEEGRLREGTNPQDVGATFLALGMGFMLFHMLGGIDVATLRQGLLGLIIDS